MFDPDITNFTEALDCGIVTLAEIPALGSNTLTITPYVMIDDVDALQSSSWSGHCTEYRHYRYYEGQLSSTGIFNSSSCDTSSKTYAGGKCISQVMLRFSTNIVTNFTSDRLLDRKQMFIDEGGIVGFVMFLTWFLGIFAVPWQ